jgi:PAS domain S-box-containing protein
MHMVGRTKERGLVGRSRGKMEEPEEPGQAEQHALTMLETIPDGVLNVDEEFRFLYVNPVAERILGKKREELIGKVLWEEVPCVVGTEFERELLKAVNENQGSEFEDSWSREGDYYQVLVAPCDSGAMVFLREATEQKQLRDALAESEAWQKLIFENVKDFGIFSMDVAGRVTLWNPGAEKMYGYTQEEMMGKHSDAVFVPEDREARAPEQELAEAREGKCARDERWHIRKDGTRFFVSGAVVALHDVKGSLRGFTKVARDVTDKKRLEDELLTARQHLEETVAERTAKLQQTVTELEMFSYSISHDLRAPLRAMRSFAQILSRTTREKLDERSAEYVERIAMAAERMDRLIQDVLDYSRVGRGSIQLEPLDLESLVESVIREHPSLDPSKARVNIERPLERVLGHKASLTQCVSNLLTNGVKFVKPGMFPEVRVRTERRDARVRLWVEDNGIGIPEEYRDRIFGIFHRAPGAEHYEGTGIGLAIVRRAIERMGGSAGVESKPGQGSKFWVELPGTGLR